MKVFFNQSLAQMLHELPIIYKDLAIMYTKNWFVIPFVVAIMGTEFPKFLLLVRETAQVGTSSNVKYRTIHKLPNAIWRFLDSPSPA